MDLQVKPTKDAAKATKRNKGKAVSVKRKRSRKKASNNASKAAIGPCQTLNAPASTNTTVLQSKDQKTILDNIGERKKKRRKKKKSNEKKHVGTKRKAAGANAGATVGKANLKTSRHKTTNVVNNVSNKRFDGPCNTDDTGNFSKFDNSEPKIINEGVLNHNGRGTEVQAEPKIHDVQNVRMKTIDKDLVKWEHLALIVEEYFLTVNNP